MTKLWCIAIAMGGPEDGMVVVGTQMSDLQEMAVAQAVSDVYRQTGTKLPLMGVNARELTREYLVEALRLIDEDEQKSPLVVPLPRIVGGVMQPTTEADLHPAEREMLRQAIEDVKCPECGATEDYPGLCPKCGPRPGYIPVEDEPA